MDEKKRVLIVDDEKNIVNILKFNLQKEGYDTLEAYDGEAGLQLALPGKSGPDPAGRHAAKNDWLGCMQKTA